MTPYRESFWKDAPVDATHWGVLHEVGLFLKEFHPGFFNNWGAGANSGSWSYAHNPVAEFGELHAKPTAYTPAAQLVDQYRKEHGTEIEADAHHLMSLNILKPGEEYMKIVATYTRMLEIYLAAERARIETDE